MTKNYYKYFLKLRCRVWNLSNFIMKNIHKYVLNLRGSISNLLNNYHKVLWRLCSASTSGKRWKTINIFFSRITNKRSLSMTITKFLLGSLQICFKDMSYSVENTLNSSETDIFVEEIICSLIPLHKQIFVGTKGIILRLWFLNYGS